MIWKADPLAGSHVEELAYPELRDLQEGIRDFEFIAVMPTSLYGYSRVLQNGKSEPVQIESTPVSHDFFRVLGVSPVLGRDFAASDEQVGAAPVVIVSNRVWRDQLSADAHIVGRVIRLNGQGYTVIGVMADGVEFPRGAGLWFPLGVDRAVVDRRGATFLQAIARTKPGVSQEHIAVEVNAVFRRVARDHPEAYTTSQRGVVTPLVEYWTGSARLHLWIMLGAALLLLLASIISASNLLFTRALQRRYEIATRLALGARYRQILTQLGAEGILIAAHFFSHGLGRGTVGSSDAGAMGARRYSAIAASGLEFGELWVRRWNCGPERYGVHDSSGMGSHTEARGVRSSRRRDATVVLAPSRDLRYVFVMAHSAVTVILLVLASLLVLSYRAMMSADIGFANRDALTMNLQLHGPGLFSAQAFDAKYRRSFYRELLDRLRQQPGVKSAAAVLLRPLEGTIGWDVSYEFEFEAANKDKRVLPKANYEVVTPGYFKTVGTSLLEGRDFSEHDSETSEPVAIISQSLAQRIHQAGYVPLGYKIRLGLSHDRWTKIIGVCADARYRSITQKGADIFVPYLQAAQPTNYVVIRGTQSPSDLASMVRRTLSSMDPSQTIAGIATIGELVDANSARHRFNMILLLWFGACAATLAAGGVYSVIAEMIADREREITIKSALGAQRIRLAREMVSGTLAFVLIGEAAGALGVLVVTKSAAELFYGVSARDPIVVASVAAFLFAVALAASVWPAWRAASLDSNYVRRAN